MALGRTEPRPTFSANQMLHLTFLKFSKDLGSDPSQSEYYFTREAMASAASAAAAQASNEKNLLFAVPKKGRLYDKIVKLLEGAGLDYNRVRSCFPGVGLCVASLIDSYEAPRLSCVFLSQRASRTDSILPSARASP